MPAQVGKTVLWFFQCREGFSGEKVTRNTIKVWGYNNLAMEVVQDMK